MIVIHHNVAGLVDLTGMEKDATGSRGTFWSLWKFGTGNGDEIRIIFEKTLLRCGNQFKCLKNLLIDTKYGISGEENVIYGSNLPGRIFLQKVGLFFATLRAYFAQVSDAGSSKF